MEVQKIKVDHIEIQEVLPDQLTSTVAESGNLFYHPAWLKVLMEQYDFRLWKTSGPEKEHMLVAQSEGLLGSKLVSLPFSDYTLPQVRPERLPHHIKALRERFPEMPLVIKCTDGYASPRDLHFMGEPVSKACLHRVVVDKQSIRRMSGSFRRGIRKALKSRLSAGPSDSAESLHRFYELYYLLRVERLGLIPQPFSFFQRVYDELIAKGQGFFYEVKQEDQVIASAVILREGQELYYKWGCSSRDHLHLRPNNLLFRKLLKEAEKGGYQYLDLGLSDLEETRGLIRFKNNMGGIRSTIYTYCICPETYSMPLEKQLKSRLNQLAGLVVQHRLSPAHTQDFSKSLYPLFV